jgi:hypothetical protein
MQVAGKLVVINPTQVVSEKFLKRTFVVETADQYPQSIEFQLTQDKCDYLDHYKVGEQVNVSINIRGRAWTNPQGEVKYFNTLEAWKIERVGGVPQQQQATTSNTPANEEEDDLPF